MTYKTLSRRQAAILAAMARGLIPSGGPYFSLGAGDLESQWLPRVDYAVRRMPPMTCLGIKIMLRLMDYALPLLTIKRLVSLTRLDNDRLVTVMGRAESLGALGAAGVVVVKVLIFPAFYGLKEAQEAIGYSPRFPTPPYFEGLKE
jgi:hypothetical protein